MKREIPLFVIDTKKHHKKGEVDFIVCTDKENGFVARMEIVSNEAPIATDTTRIGEPNHLGYALKMTILRHTGTNVEPAKVKSLMKKGMDYYTDAVLMNFKPQNITRGQMIEYLDKLIDSNKQFLDTRDYSERMTVAQSILFLTEIQRELRK